MRWLAKTSPGQSIDPSVRCLFSSSFSAEDAASDRENRSAEERQAANDSRDDCLKQERAGNRVDVSE